MAKRQRLVGGALLAMIGLGLLTAPGAHADNVCVGYSITAPGVGTVQDTGCQWMPDQFDAPLSVTNCRGVPPAGVVLCLEAHLMLPVP